MDRVVGEKIFKFPEKLVGQGLVVGHHECRALHLFDDVRHGEGLTAAGDAQQDLRGIAALDAGDELGDGARLVARGI